MNTIRGRILLGYLALTTSILLIVFMCFWTLQRHRDITAVQSSVYELQVQSLELKSASQQVIFSDAISNVNFHELGTTKRSRFIQQTFTDAHRSIYSLQEGPINDSWEFSADLDSLSHNLQHYEVLFDQIVSLYQQRGFKDWGAEGAMREKIHELEVNPRYISLSDILQLRRHEKDYFMRNDTSYARRLYQLADNLLSQIPKEKREWTLLSEYRELFSEIVALEQEIGNEESGLISSLLAIQEQLGEATASLQFNIDKHADRTIDNLNLILTMAVLICIIAAGISSAVLPPLIVKPLQQLSQSMKKIIDSDFRETFIDNSGQSIEEIDQLSASYNSLLRQIREQLNTVQKQNEELSELNEKLVASEQHARKLSSLKDKFFSIISHDLKGPMSTALLFLSTLQDNPESIPPEKLKELFKKLNENFINLNRLMVNLLTWAKSQMNAIKLTIQENKPTQVARQNLELFKDSIARKGLTTSVNGDESSTCLADPNMLDFIIRNIISNAIKFTPHGGHISISVNCQEEECHITIEDTGVGMTADQIRKIYSAEEYMTTKGTANEIGTGLGLSLCNEFVEQNKGTLQITSLPDQGSAFSIALPIPEKTGDSETLVVTNSEPS